MSTALNPSLTFELVGQEALVHDAAGGLVVRLTGDEHSVIQRLTSGEQIVHPTEGEQAAIDRLIEAGIVLDDETSSSKFSRRKVMQLSAAGVAAAGLSYLVLPSAAAAQSGDPTPTTAAPPPPAPSTGGDPTIGNASVLFSGNLASGGDVEVRWTLGAASSFFFNWEVVSPAVGGSRIASGTLAAGSALTSVFTRAPGQSVTVTLTATNLATNAVVASGYTLQ